MKKAWKWIIGIVLGLVVLAILVGVGFMVNNFYAYRAGGFDSRGFSGCGSGLLPYAGFGHMRGFGMMGYGWMPFGGFFGGLLSLGFLALAVMGVIWLVNRLRTPKPVEASAAIPAAVVNPCKKCGMPIQDGWQVCPHCGKKV